MLNFTFIHEALIVYVSIHVPRNQQISESVHYCRDEHWTPSSHWQLWCWVGHMPSWWPAMSQQSNQWLVQDRCSRFPLDTNKKSHCRTQPAAITFSPAEAAIIYFENSATLPPPTTIKKSCKEQIKIKFYIALRQNCDQCASMLGNMEFCITLEGRRMAPYLEQERRP